MNPFGIFNITYYIAQEKYTVHCADCGWLKAHVYTLIYEEAYYIVYTYIELGCGWLIPAPKVSKKHTSFVSLPYAAVGIETLMEYSGARSVDNSFVNKIR